MSRFARFACIGATVFVALGIGVTLVVRSQIDPATLKAKIETEAGKALGRTVRVGSVAASWGLAVGIRDLQIMDAEGKTPQVSLSFARVAVALAPLLRGEMKLAAVSLEGLSVKAVRNADGSLDSADVLARLGIGAAGAGQAGTRAPGDTVTVSFAGARFELTDHTGALQTRLRWSEVAGSISSGEEIKVGLAGQLDAPGSATRAGAAGDLSLASRLVVSADYSLAASEGKLSLTGKDIALERVRAVVPALRAAPVHASGLSEASATFAFAAGRPAFSGLTASFHDVQLTGAAALTGINGEVSYQGSTVDVSGLTVRAGAAHVVVPRASIAVKPGGIAAETVNLLVNDLPVAASVSVSGWPAAPQITLRVAAPDADLAKLSGQCQGRVRMDVTVSGSPARPSAIGTIALLCPARVVLPESAGGVLLQVSAGTLALNGQDLSTADLTCQVMGFTCKPRLRLSSLFSCPQVAFDSGPLQLDLTRLAAMLSGELASRVKAASPQGQIKAALRATGPLSAPRLSGAIEPEGVSIAVPGTGRRVSLSRGAVDIAGSRAVLSGITVVHEGIALVVSGGIEGLTGTPRVSLDVSGKNLQVARLVALLPPESARPLEPLHPAGQVDLEALVAGTATTLRADARISLRGLSVVAASGERKFPVTFNSGAVEVTPGAVSCRGVEGVVEGVPFQVAGQVRDYLTEPAFDLTAMARGLNVERLRGFAPDELLAEVHRRRVQVSFDARVTVKGTRAAPTFALRVLPTAGSLPLPVAGRTLTATLSPGGEIALQDRTVVFSGLPVTVAQNTVKVSGSIKNPQGDAALDLKIEGQSLNVSGLAPLLPDAAKRSLAQSGFRGGKGVRASVGGTVSAPQIEAVVDLTGAEFTALGPLGAGRIPRGALKLTSSGLVIEGLSLTLGSAPFEVGGRIALTHPPTLAITVKSDAADLATLSARLPLPAGVSLSGTTRVDLKIEGPAAEPRASGRIALAGMGVRLPVLAAPLQGEGGELVLSGDDLVITDASFRAGASRVTARGRVVRFMRDATLDGVEITGPVELADLAGRVGVALAGKGTVEARASGTARDLRVEGSLSVPAGAYAMKSGGAVPLRDLLADFSRGPTQLKIGRLSGTVAGGKLGGTLLVNQTEPPGAVMNLTLDGADLAAFMPPGGDTAMSGHAAVSFNGNAAGGLETLSGNGQVKLASLVVDLSRSSQLQQLRYKAGVGSVGASLLGKLKGFQDFGNKAGAEADFYAEVLGEAKQSHEMGTVTAPIAVNGGVLRMEPIQGPRLSGRIVVNLVTGAIQGAIDKLELGRAALPLEFGGTLSSPRSVPDRSNITLDGKRLTEVLAATSATPEQPATTVEQDVVEKLAGKNAKLLNGILGKGGDDPSAPAAAPGGSVPAVRKKKKKLAGQILDALTGADPAPAAPAPEDPAPAEPAPDEAAEPPPPVDPPKKKKNKLFDAILQNIK